MNDQILNRTLSVRSVIALTAMFLIFSFASFAQSEKKYIRQGNREYEDKKYPESETTYRRALDENSESRDAVFNIGDALYKQKKYEDAAKQFIENQNINENKGKKSESLYNLGNSLLMANKLQESIDAYKGSLRLNPKKPEAKYNLAYAQDLLKQQQQQQQQQNDKNKQDQDKEDQSKNNDQQQKTPPQDQQQQDKQQGISREDAERVLNALENDEKNVQEKVKLAKALKEKVRTVKNW